jgi:hypothetical protein
LAALKGRLRLDAMVDPGVTAVAPPKSPDDVRRIMVPGVLLVRGLGILWSPEGVLGKLTLLVLDVVVVVALLPPRLVERRRRALRDDGAAATKGSLTTKDTIPAISLVMPLSSWSLECTNLWRIQPVTRTDRSAYTGVCSMHSGTVNISADPKVRLRLGKRCHVGTLIPDVVAIGVVGVAIAVAIDPSCNGWSRGIVAVGRWSLGPIVSFSTETSGWLLQLSRAASLAVVDDRYTDKSAASLTATSAVAEAGASTDGVVSEAVVSASFVSCKGFMDI